MKEWILPCNVQSYELDAALRDLKRIEWNQSRLLTNIAVGDIVYLYSGIPVQAICWKCEVTAVQRTTSEIDDSMYSHTNTQNSGTLIELRAIYEYDVKHYLSLGNLLKHGLNSAPQGPRRVEITPELEKYLHKIDALQASSEEQEKDAHTQSMSELRNIVRKQATGKVISQKIETIQFHRNTYVAEYTKRRANGCCQLCGYNAPFNYADGTPYLESHHIIWLSQGGLDDIYNTVALCPNCHRKMHIVKDAKDVQFLQAVVNRLEIT